MSKVQEFTQLDEVAEITMGQSPDATSYNTDEYGLPFLQGCAEFGKQSPSTNVYCFPPLRTSKPNSILISVRAPVGKTNWGEQNYCIGRGLAGIKARPECADTHFLSYAINQNVSFLHRRSQGSTFLAIGANDLKIFPIPSISYPKQKKISLILGSVDRAIAHTEALIEKYQQIKAGLMHDLFTRGIGADGKLRPLRDEAPELYQESAIGWIPIAWKLKPIEYGLSASPKNGYSPKEVENWQGVYVLGLSCLTKNGFSPIHLKNAPKTSLRSGAKLEDGDFLISRSNTPELVGLCGIYRDIRHDTIYPDLMMKLKLNQHIVAEFLEQYLLLQATRQRIAAIAVGTSSSMVKINATTLKALKIVYPHPNEQREIVNKLQPIMNQIACLESQLSKLQKQKSGLMHDLLTGKVPVKVDPDEVDHISN